MKRLLSAVLLVLLLALVPSPAHARTEEINLSVGEEAVLNDIVEFGVEDRKVLTAIPSKDGKSLIVRGARSGRTKMLIRDSKGESRTLDVAVAKRDPKLVTQELEALLRNYPDITLRQSRNMVIMEGAVKTERELQQIKEIEERFEGQVSNLVTQGPSGVRRHMMVRLDMHFVQVHRRLLRNFGVRYPDKPIPLGGVVNFALDAAGIAMPIASMMGNQTPITRQSLVSDLMPSLDLNESNGYVKIVRTDTMITENGERAMYHSGTEVPLRLTGALGGGSVQMIFYGAELSVTPRLSASNDAVSLELTADISQRDSSLSPDGIPLRIIDKLQTNVHIPIGQSVVLSAVDLKGESRATHGLPWLNRIPVLGYLFGSESKDSEAAYGVIYITPTLVQSTTSAFKEQIDTALSYVEKPSRLRR